MKNRSIRPHRGIRNSRADRVFYGVNGVLMALTFLLYAWPLWFVLIASFSDPNLVQAGQVLLLPKGFHLGGYKLILEYQDILRGYLNSILYTVVGTALNLVMTICAAYPLSRSEGADRPVRVHHVFLWRLDPAVFAGQKPRPLQFAARHDRPERDLHL